ncbi:MAG: SHOCT domain-containing protein [Sulfuricurvum sp.]|uniref:SHOCT domain-containing protein n=1 Tax=Sulfuricurvum sp. TaxID=2025608 RepID=UPI0026295B83|nr:SHOCT domain-containing protein [Sulfuricurvum sp.]MDD5160765.1 SHOCT domain-containing protein [Sulfuricurvum sp.]
MNEYSIHEMGFGWLIVLLVIILILYVINNNKEEQSAQDILDKRYANGEIDDTEYKIKKADLEK